MGLPGSGTFGAPKAECGAHDNQRWSLGFVNSVLDSALDADEVVAVVDLLDVPVHRFEPLADVFTEDQASRAGQRDLVRVVQVDDLAQTQVPGEACRFIGNALHQIAVRREAECAVIDDGVAGPIVGGGEMCLGHGQPDAIGESLAEWASC